MQGRINSQESKIPDSKIKESTKFRDILDNSTVDTVFIFDIDNVVMELTDESEGVCSDQGFVYLLNYAATLELKSKEAIQSVVTIYNAMQKHVKVKPVEESSVKIIAALQDVRNSVIALTSRGHDISSETDSQLKSIGVDFSKQFENIYVELGEGGSKNKAIFKDGITYCNGNKKGPCLSLLFDTFKSKPKHVVMIDDKIDHLDSVKKVIKSEFHGIRYGFLDKKVQQFDPEKMKKQLKLHYHKLPGEAQKAVEKLNMHI